MDSLRVIDAHGASEKAVTRAAAAEAEYVARASYGRLLAVLAARTGDLALAEDALADAFERALRTWSDSGVPDNPEAWLLTVARNSRLDVLRSAAYRRTVPLDSSVVTGGTSPVNPDTTSAFNPGVTSPLVSGVTSTLATPANALDDMNPDAIPDRRLALLFVCAHPAIAPGIRTPLMLQTVLGFDARRIAQAYAIPESTMAQRLVRAKRRIRDARIPFMMPERSQMAGRLHAVLEAIYGAYAIEWHVIAGTTTRDTLADEALYLAITLAELLEDEPEAFGLAALITLSMARAPARGSADTFVPLEQQDTGLWDANLIAQGEQFLRRARTLGRIGRFQLEAAIQSLHCDRATTGRTDWHALRKLYAALVSISPTVGARIAHAAAVGRVDGPEAGLAALDAISEKEVLRFQPAWATRAHLLEEAGRLDEAITAYDKAVSVTTERGLRRYLVARREACAIDRSTPPTHG